MKPVMPGALLLLLLSTAPAQADTTDARCDVYPRGEDHTDNSGPCVFSQRQGYVTITRQDGVRHELTPQGDQPGNYLDQRGAAVYRQSGLGSAGQIYRFADESVYVYWQTMASTSQDTATSPYSTADYDATTLLPCSRKGVAREEGCAAGILLMEDGQASIVVSSPAGEEFTLNFMTGYVNATGGREVDARLRGDTWFVTVDGDDAYEVPLAAIEGG